MEKKQRRKAAGLPFLCQGKKARRYIYTYKAGTSPVSGLEARRRGHVRADAT